MSLLTFFLMFNLMIPAHTNLLLFILLSPRLNSDTQEALLKKSVPPPSDGPLRYAAQGLTAMGAKQKPKSGSSGQTGFGVPCYRSYW
jgi:hypothetical protein